MFIRLALKVLSVVVASVALTGIAAAASVAPVLVPDNPTCQDLGFRFDFKPQPEPPPAGTYTFPDGVNTVTITTTGSGYEIFDWSSTLSIDAVIVKGGPNAFVYYYDPESFGDVEVLSAPNGSTNGGTAAVSHINFCYDYEVTVDKTATPTFTRTWHWDIDKTVTPAAWALFANETGTSLYTVSVEKTDDPTDSDWAVSGVVAITNDTPFDATIASVTDVLSDETAVTLICGVDFPYILTSGNALTCTYALDLDSGDGLTNTATVTTDPDGIVGGGEASADFAFDFPTTEVNAEINVTDSNGASWGPVDDDAVWRYERTFGCNGDQGSHPNTATIYETGQFDEANVSVSCYELDVTKDADTSFNRYFDWSLEKVAGETELLLTPGQEHVVNYTITLDATYEDGDFEVSGDIFVTNPAPVAAVLTGVTDVPSTGGPATVTCGVDFPYTLAAGATLTCGYTGSVTSADAGLNTATATRANFAYDWEDPPATMGSTQISGTFSYGFDLTSPDELFDDCVDLFDDYGVPGEWNALLSQPVCVANLPFAYFYTMAFGPYDVEDCDGHFEFVNTAMVVEGDSEWEATSSETVTIDIACEPTGCTLTPGYWKTHSSYGPAPYDDTWAAIGEDSPFFLSGQSWYEVLWTAPQGGNAYYILAHAYIAAELNGENGADTGDIENTLDEALTFLSTWTPAQVADFKGRNKDLREQALAWAAYLDAYNNGLVGPPHCSE